MHQLKAVRSAIEEEAEDVMTGAATNLTDKIESGRVSVSERDETIQDQATQLSALSTQLSQMKALPPPPAAASDDAKEEIANLQRENKLIASAWYDLTCRLQSNTVMLARRQEVPKSWLGRQRIVVSGQGKRVGS